VKVALIQFDGSLPNLALMKLSSYYKQQGAKVQLNDISGADKIFVSCIFDWNKSQALGITKMFSNVCIGGPGIDLNKQLPNEIEHIKPDYSLYDLDYSMGFTSRGCIRNCPFCIVPKKEGYIKDHAPISEFYDESHTNLILLDNNFLASPRCLENLDYLINNDIYVNFHQGLDIRLVNEENIGLLYSVNSYDHKFNKLSYYFAWDLMKDEKQVRKGIHSLLEYGFKADQLMFYMLVGFNTTFEEDMHRFNVLRGFGVRPFVMKYNNCQDKKLNRFARWVNRPNRLYEFVEFENYTRKKIVA